MRARLALVVALVAVMSALAAAPIGSGYIADNPLLWTGNPFATTVLAQSEPAQAPTVPEAVEEAEPEPEPVQGPPEPDVVEEPVQGPPEPDVVEEPQQSETVEEAEPEPAPEPPTLGDVWATLQGAITAEAANSVTVGAAEDALTSVLQALADAELAHAAAMEGQGEHDANIRTAAQALVDFVTVNYLE